MVSQTRNLPFESCHKSRWETEKNKETQPQHSNKLGREGLRCSKTSRMTNSPNPHRCSLPGLPPSLSLLPLLFPLHLFHRVSLELKSELDCFPGAQKKLEIRARMDEVSKTNPYIVQSASLFLPPVDVSLFACLIIQAKRA